MINFAKYNCHSWYHETVMEQETLSHVKIYHLIEKKETKWIFCLFHCVWVDHFGPASGTRIYRGPCDIPSSSIISGINYRVTMWCNYIRSCEILVFHIQIIFCFLPFYFLCNIQPTILSIWNDIPLLNGFIY